MIRTRVALLLTALPSRVRVTRADDAYVQLRSLELELRRLHLEGRRHLVYGSINMCAMPSTPHAVVGYQGAWLGRLENFKTAQAMRRSVANSLRRSTQAQPGAGCQQPGCQSGRAALASQAPLPFATGDLQVMDGELSRAVFGQCLYLKTFHEAGRRANRRSGCRPDGPDFARSWATLTCDWCAHPASRGIGSALTTARLRAQCTRPRRGGMRQGARHSSNVCTHDADQIAQLCGGRGVHDGERTLAPLDCRARAEAP